MKQTTLLENDKAVVWYYPQHGLVYHEFREPASGQEFKDVLLSGLEILESKPEAVKWLSDDRVNSNLSMEDNDWSSNYWLPKAIKAGWKYWANVLPEKKLGQINIKRIGSEIAELGVTVQFFSNPKEAMDWLLNQS